ncbi:hypothetical protein [Streptomyces evansiae]|uniref:hypothetical protein n=1 Tax=Streptomyces evansiae TaxID=3075535 RepID=UPI002887851C|nr:hypothetical protein [Streptomyces sp. DSM 41859]MDT0421167.1 hypothetical protein [Streptomyces sp. DSM 41859]
MVPRHPEGADADDSTFQWWSALSDALGAPPSAADARNPDGWIDGRICYAADAIRSST